MKIIEVPAIVISYDFDGMPMCEDSVIAKVVLSKINYWYELRNKCYIVLDNGETLQTDLDMEEINQIIETEEKA